MLKQRAKTEKQQHPHKFYFEKMLLNILIWKRPRGKKQQKQLGIATVTDDSSFRQGFSQYIYYSTRRKKESSPRLHHFPWLHLIIRMLYWTIESQCTLLHFRCYRILLHLSVFHAVYRGISSRLSGTRENNNLSFLKPSPSIKLSFCCCCFLFFNLLLYNELLSASEIHKRFLLNSLHTIVNPVAIQVPWTNYPAQSVSRH